MSIRGLGRLREEYNRASHRVAISRLLRKERMMHPILFSLLATALATELPWSELSLSIERDRYTSSDQMTLCRVRVVNHGWHTWPGRGLRFEARAIQGGVVVARERGRFGLSLPPRGSLETLIGFLGRYERFEVAPVPGHETARPSRRRRKI